MQVAHGPCAARGAEPLGGEAEPHEEDAALQDELGYEGADAARAVGLDADPGTCGYDRNLCAAARPLRHGPWWGVWGVVYGAAVVSTAPHRQPC
jgi:hypothetical protein